MGTKFRHVDLNVRQWLAISRGKNHIQASISLDQETEETCTTVVLRGHNTLRQWWAEVERCDLVRNGNTVRVDDLYTKEDREKFGDFTPQVCSPGTLRISLPTVLHGATAGHDGKAPCGRVR